MKRARVVWRAKFESFVEYDGTEDGLDDAISGVDIPENENSQYICNSFDVFEVEDVEDEEPE